MTFPVAISSHSTFNSALAFELAHLAAALGCETWVLLSFASDWRWGLGDTSPWYPGVRLFRQPDLGDWETPVGRVAGELGRRFGVKGPAVRSGRPAAGPADAGAPLLQAAFDLAAPCFVNAASEAKRGLPFSLVPNPASGSFQVKMEGAQEALRLEICDATGRRLSLRNDVRAGESVQVEAPGVYLVRVATWDGRAGWERLVVR